MNKFVLKQKRDLWLILGILVTVLIAGTLASLAYSHQLNLNSQTVDSNNQLKSKMGDLEIQLHTQKTAYDNLYNAVLNKQATDVATTIARICGDLPYDHSTSTYEQAVQYSKTPEGKTYAKCSASVMSVYIDNYVDDNK